MVKDASDLNSSGRLLKVVEISDSRCFFEVQDFIRIWPWRARTLSVEVCTQ